MALEYLFLVFILIFIVLVFLYLRLRRRLLILEEEHERLNFDHKSMNVKHGQQFESFVPFVNEYPGKIENTVFLGKPIDFISFDDDCIRFIEVKTGTSALSEKQRKIKNLIEDKKIKWYEMRFEK